MPVSTGRPAPCGHAGPRHRAYYNFIAGSDGVIACGDSEEPIDYVILASGMPGVFQLGGDFDLFRQKIDNRDRNALTTYGRACIDVLYRNYRGHDLPLTTVSLVLGECLGGGFEAALSSDVIVAKKSSCFGFPEILFNLFPGMGANSFLDRKVGQRKAEDIISSGKIYSAEEMRELGVIDVVAEYGAGEAAVNALIKQRSRSRNGLAALAAVRRRVHQITYEELEDIRRRLGKCCPAADHTRPEADAAPGVPSERPAGTGGYPLKQLRFSASPALLDWPSSG
jgi:DSF synthase